jgi:transposase
MQVTTVGLDLAKNLFQAHGITDDGEVAVNHSLRRAQVLLFFKRLGHEVRQSHRCTLKPT